MPLTEENDAVGRPADLQAFIEAARSAFGESATDPRARQSVSRIFDSIDRSVGTISPGQVKLPVCEYLPEVTQKVLETSTSLGRLVHAFVRVEPLLSWTRRLSYDQATASDNFSDGHGNCMVIGPGGLEDRAGLGLGVSLLAPDVKYPDHHHAPEETYLVATEGMFRQADGEWFSPGVAGSFYNVPMIRHSMKSGKEPLLAFWALWSR